MIGRSYRSGRRISASTLEAIRIALALTCQRTQTPPSGSLAGSAQSSAFKNWPPDSALAISTSPPTIIYVTCRKPLTYSTISRQASTSVSQNPLALR